MKILMHINIRHDPAAVRIVFQVIENTVYLIHHSFFIFMLHLHLISVGLTDRACLIRPAVPDMTVQVMNVI